MVEDILLKGKKMITDDNRQREDWEDERGHRAFDHPVVDFFALQRIKFLLTLLNIKDNSGSSNAG